MVRTDQRVGAALALYRWGAGVPMEVALGFEWDAADPWRTDNGRSHERFDRLDRPWETPMNGETTENR